MFLFPASRIYSGQESGFWIYPNCGYGQSLATGDVHDQLDGEEGIRSALAGGDFSNWYYLSAEQNYENWPITVTVTNDMLSNEVTFAFSSPTVDLECVFSDSFQHEVDLKIGIGPDAGNNDETVRIESIVISS